MLTRFSGLSSYSLTAAGSSVTQNQHLRLLDEVLALLPHICVSTSFMLSLLSTFWHTGNRSETSNITNWIQVRAELTLHRSPYMSSARISVHSNAFAFNLISLSCMKSKSLIRDIMISFVGFDERLKPVIGAMPLNRVSNATRRIGNLMCLGTCSYVSAQAVSMIIFAVTVVLGSLFGGLHSALMIDIEHIWTVFYFISFAISKLSILLFDFQFVNCLIFICKRIGILSDCAR